LNVTFKNQLYEVRHMKDGKLKRLFVALVSFPEFDESFREAIERVAEQRRSPSR
jgi:hypothetical protein